MKISHIITKKFSGFTMTGSYTFIFILFRYENVLGD